MAYTTHEDIASEFKNIEFSATSAITSTAVTSFIEEEEALVNAMLSSRYETPVTDTESKLILKKIVIDFVAYRVAKILNLKKDVPIPEKVVVQQLSEGAAFKMSKQYLEMIRKGAIILSGATAQSNGQGVYSYNYQESVLPKFERDTKQW